MLFANEWVLSTALLQLHEDKLHPVRFCGRVLKGAEMNYHPAEKEVLALLLLLKTCYTQLAGRTLHVSTRFSTLDWITKSKSRFGRAVQWAALLSPWHLIVQRIKEKECAFTRLLQSTTEKNGGYGSCAWVVWRLPEWTICVPGVNNCERRRIHRDEQWSKRSIRTGADKLVGVGDSRLAIQQSLGVIAYRKETLMAQLNHHKELTSKLKSVKYLHILREFNAAADSLATEALESKISKVVLDESRKLELASLNRI
ncbi:hypothetical protein PHMEG_00016484 [Phytophthora megakarya]|uniref:Reverse transcriptase RNase H-like domain-containing protein n=1 Tax=Phytophthora megakarya TaxID=4795 RepID=A0A225VZS9_9STRA|nr:hypothetical protein PHMEG_00016484 [Phytophthora megakarya]